MPRLVFGARLQRHDDASQQSASNSGTPKWAEVDEPMDFSQPIFGHAMPAHQDPRRVSQASVYTAVNYAVSLCIIFRLQLHKHQQLHSSRPSLPAITCA